MGQQQLLLLVLGIVIVGLAVVVGINAFGENQKRANADALVNDGLRIASDIQAWALKPAQFGGAGGWDSANVDAEDNFFRDVLGYQGVNGDGDVNNVNGTIAVEGTGGDSGVQITATNGNQDNLVYVTVCGVRSGDIETAIDFNAVDGSPSGNVTQPVCGSSS